ncbi:MAG: LytTR family DNA-binding domain-containing protein [Rikenellaceae bacterium]
MRLKTIVIDDEPLAAMLLEGYIAKSPFLEHIATFSTAVEAIGSTELSSADLLLLDIQMPTLTGLEFSRMVEPHTRIIFTTAFNQYALDGYRVNALDYLLKPISYADFLVATKKAVEWFNLKGQAEKISLSTPLEEEQRVDSIYVKSEYKLIRIELSNILYIEGLKDYVKFFIEGESKPIISLMNMKRVEEILPADQFIRVHRSFTVRKDKIKVIERSRIIFGEERIPIGESYKPLLQEYLKLRSI